jgi:hypothetical protein
MNDDLPYSLPDSVYEAKQWIAQLSAELAKHGIELRDPPDEPTGCCGNGCIGCVWEGYYSAVGYWCDQAREALLKHS